MAGADARSGCKVLSAINTSALWPVCLAAVCSVNETRRCWRFGRPYAGTTCSPGRKKCSSSDKYCAGSQRALSYAYAHISRRPALGYKRRPGAMRSAESVMRPTSKFQLAPPKATKACGTWTYCLRMNPSWKRGIVKQDMFSWWSCSPKTNFGKEKLNDNGVPAIIGKY